MSGLATVTYAPVSMVTMHGLLPTQPWVTRLGSAFSVMTLNAWWRGSNAYAGVRPSPPTVASFPTVGYFSSLYLCCCRVDTLVSPAILDCSLVVRLLGPGAIYLHLFCHIGNHAQSGPAVYSSNILIVGWATIGTSGMSWCYCLEVGPLAVLPAALALVGGPRLPFSLLPAAAESWCQHRLSRMRMI
jgi:hypothetical protein